MTSVRSRVVGVAVAVFCAVLALSGCASSPSSESPTVAEAQSAVPAPLKTADSESTVPDQSNLGPIESFQAWLVASRAPDVDAACAQLAPDLQARMIAELNASGAMQIATCEEMIAATAELYRALGQSAEVDIVLERETENDAVLFVTYLASGNCGTVDMTRSATDWIITEQTQECAE